MLSQGHVGLSENEIGRLYKWPRVWLTGPCGCVRHLCSVKDIMGLWDYAKTSALLSGGLSDRRDLVDVLGVRPHGRPRLLFVEDLLSTRTPGFNAEFIQLLCVCDCVCVCVLGSYGSLKKPQNISVSLLFRFYFPLGQGKIDVR